MYVMYVCMNAMLCYVCMLGFWLVCKVLLLCVCILSVFAMYVCVLCMVCMCVLYVCMIRYDVLCYVL